MMMYKRLILSNPINPSYYEWFTDYLLQCGPDWQEEANKLTDLYTKADFQRACDSVQKIECDKDYWGI